MRVLVITNMFPIPEHKYFGIFVKEQVEALSKYYPDLYINTIFINGFSSKFNYLKSVFSINYHLIFNKYDVIHIHFGLSGLFSLFNPFLKTPIVTMLHSADTDIKKSTKMIVSLSKLVILRSDFIFYLNDQMKLSISKLNKNLMYLPCGIDTNFFVRESKLNSGKLTIGFPGNPKRMEKNYSLFLLIIEELKALNILVDIRIFHGLTRREVVDNLNFCDLLLMTSISEGSPQIVKEAMSCNVPVISSNVGDVSVLLDGVSNSFVVNSFEPVDFVEKIVSLNNLEKESRISNGRERVLKLGLDHSTISNKIMNVYKYLIGNA